MLKRYIHTAGGIINTLIVIAAGLQIVKINPGILECNGGYVVLKNAGQNIANSL